MLLVLQTLLYDCMKLGFPMKICLRWYIRVSDGTLHVAIVVLDPVQ